MRIAMVVPVAAVPGERSGWAKLAHRYIPLAHGRAQAARGAEVHLFFDGPRERVEVARGLTVHVTPGRLPSGQGALRSPHLVRAALSVRPDVLHLHHLLALENLAAATLGRAPVFAEFHGGGVSRWALKRRLLRAVSARLAGAFFPSPAHRAALLRAGAWHPATPWHLSPETTARHDARSPRPPTEVGAPRVLVVARAEAPKAPLRTLEVLERVVERAPRAALRWACPGGRDLGLLQDALRVAPAVRARLELGPIPFERMAQAYAWADVVVATSEREIGGTVVSEALAQGTPVAADWLPTFEALAGGCGAVRLLRGQSARALAEAALELAAQPNLRDLARARFEAALSFDAIAGARAEVYERRASQSPLSRAR